MLDPAVIDMMVFCTKNPSPMFDSFALFQEGDVIKDAKQVSWKDRQMSIFDLL